MGLLTYGESGGMPGLLNMDDPNMQLMLAGLTMMANKRGANAQNAIPMGINQFMQMRSATQNAQNEKLDREMKMKEYELRMNEIQRQQAERQKVNDAYARLGNPSGYMKPQNVTTERPVYSPSAPMPGDVAPNFGMSREMVPTTTQKQIFDQEAQMRDMWAIPELRAKLIEQQFAPQERDYFVAPDGSLIDKKTGQKAEGNYAKPEDSQTNPNKPFMVVDGQIVPNKAYQDYEFTKAEKGRAQNNVNVGGAQILPEKFTDKLNMLAAENLMNQYGESKNASTAVSAVKDAMALLDKGMFTGKAGPIQEQLAGWYQASTGRPLPQLDATQQFKTVIGDIVLPALSNLKGASSDRDFQKIEEYSRGESTMTESALRGHLQRLQNKYGKQMQNFNQSLDDYFKQGGQQLPGVRRFDEPAGNLPNQTAKPANQSKSRQFNIGGVKMIGTLGADGNYYVTRNGKKYRVEE